MCVKSGHRRCKCFPLAGVMLTEFYANHVKLKTAGFFGPHIQAHDLNMSKRAEILLEWFNCAPIRFSCAPTRPALDRPYGPSKLEAEHQRTQPEKPHLAESLGLPWPRPSKSAGRLSSQQLWREVYDAIECGTLPEDARADPPTWWHLGESMQVLADDTAGEAATGSEDAPAKKTLVGFWREDVVP
eukprot:4865295-Amphidinium_carterae.2